jgi:hypothetical protein
LTTTKEHLVGQRTTEDVYEKVVDVEGALADHHKSAVTKAHFDVKIKGLEDSIKKLPTKQDDPQNWRDLVKEMSPVKEFIAATKGGDLISTFILAGAAVVAAVGIVAGAAAAFKKAALAYSGRERTRFLWGDERPENERQRQYIGRLPDGQVKPNGKPKSGAGSQSRRLPPPLPPSQSPSPQKLVSPPPRTRCAISIPRSAPTATRSVDSPPPRAMRQMASAAKKLESAAKNHQNVSGLASSIGNLNREMRELAATAG